MSTASSYYVPEQSKWPIIAAVGLFITMLGASMLVGDIKNNVQDSYAHWIFFAGSLIIAYMMFGWFGNVIKENHQGLYNDQMDRSFRYGMSWFIFTEVMFFACFFGALFYVRALVVPWLGGEGAKGMSHALWPTFEANWPLLNNPDASIVGPKAVIDPWKLPLLNTGLLLASSITAWLAHHALRKEHRKPLIFWLFVTIALGATFLFFQVEEYIEAYTHLDLTLSSGIYGTTFFMLTGFHGAHVTLGAIMLTVMLFRILKGHFKPDDHFAFEAASWYWHFVDVVWVCLFIFVYIL